MGRHSFTTITRHVVSAALADIEALKAKPDITSSTTAPVNAKDGDLWFNPTTLKFAFYTSGAWINPCLLYTSPSPRDRTRSRMPSSA